MHNPSKFQELLIELHIVQNWMNINRLEWIFTTDILTCPSRIYWGYPPQITWLTGTLVITPGAFLLCLLWKESMAAVYLKGKRQDILLFSNRLIGPHIHRYDMLFALVNLTTSDAIENKWEGPLTQLWNAYNLANQGQTKNIIFAVIKSSENIHGLLSFTDTQ